MHKALAYEFDLTNETVLNRKEAARFIQKLQKRRKAVHINQLTRWMRTGIRGVPLPSLLVASRRITTTEAIEWWIRATTAADNHADALGTPRPARGRGNRSVRPLTNREKSTLAKAGLGGGK